VGVLVLATLFERGSAIDFLDTMQTQGGGFVSERWTDGNATHPTLRTTRTALRAYRLLGGMPPNRDRIIAYLRGCQNPDGGFASEPGSASDPISTSVALMVFRELQLPYEPYVERGLKYMNDHTQGFEQIRMVASSLDELHVTVPNASRWLEEIDRARNSDGSFGSGPGRARETALYVVAELRLGGKLDTPRVLKAVSEGQRGDGGFGHDKPGGSDLEACYRVIRLFYRLGVTPENVDKLRQFISSCRNEDGGYGRTPDERSSLHGTYYAAIITHWLDGLEQGLVEQWNFDDAPTGELPTGWMVARALEAPGSRWQVRAEGGRPDNRVLAQISSEGPKKQFNICTVEKTYRDVSLSVKIHARSGEIDRGGGIVWRYTDAQNYYVARWNPLEMNFRLYKVVAGVRSQLDTAQAEDGAAGWHTLKIITVGRDIRGYFDGRLLLEAEDDQFSLPGKIGLWSKADAATEFDDFSALPAYGEALEAIGK
jgi:prenyltransferase beta subunit